MGDLKRHRPTAGQLVQRLSSKLDQHDLIDIKCFAVGTQSLDSERLAADLLATLEAIDRDRTGSVQATDIDAVIGEAE